MALVPELVSVAECLSYMGKADCATPHEIALLADDVKPRVERAIRAKCGSGLVWATYDEFLPVANPSDMRDRIRWQYSSWHVADGGMTLQLNELPVRQILNVWADYTGVSRGGQGPNAFSDPNTLLVLGQDYYLDQVKPGFSETGGLLRVNYPWPSEPRSVKVQYIAGYQRKELLGQVEDYRLDASDLRLGALVTVAANFAIANAMTASDDVDAVAMAMGARIKSERLADWSTSYEYPEGNSDSSIISSVFIPPRAAEYLSRFVKTAFLVS
jgi:hypothetical protein